MIDHCGVFATNFAKSKTFYDAAFAPLGARVLMTVPVEHTGGKGYIGYGQKKPDFWVVEAAEAGPGRHYAFTAKNRAEVDAFYKAAIAAGGRDNGAPGLRPHYHASYYGAFVFDPDGNNVEAVCHAPE
jgi:catechol 2,3-dioxygenase-like lactoylglutathione lyase family enzyme